MAKKQSAADYRCTCGTLLITFGRRVPGYRCPECGASITPERNKMDNTTRRPVDPGRDHTQAPYAKGAQDKLGTYVNALDTLADVPIEGGALLLYVKDLYGYSYRELAAALDYPSWANLQKIATGQVDLSGTLIRKLHALMDEWGTG